MPRTTIRWGIKRTIWNERQKLQVIKNEELRQNMTQKPVSEVEKMLAKHQLKLVKGRGIIQV